MQKAIIVTSYKFTKEEGKYSIEEFNKLLNEGCKVITCSPMSIVNPNTSEFMVIIEGFEKSSFKPEFV